jgi:hypothetical protein
MIPNARIFLHALGGFVIEFHVRNGKRYLLSNSAYPSLSPAVWGEDKERTSESNSCFVGFMRVNIFDNKFISALARRIDG